MLSSLQECAIKAHIHDGIRVHHITEVESYANIHYSWGDYWDCSFYCKKIFNWWQRKQVYMPGMWETVWRETWEMSALRREAPLEEWLVISIQYSVFSIDLNTDY